MGLWIGIGCQRGVSKLAIQRAIESVFTEYNLDLATVTGLATLDRKANEPGLIEYCHESGWFLKIYSPERLNSVAVGNPSPRVSALVETVSVAEAAALCAAQTNILLVPKQTFRLGAKGEFVTLAIAGVAESSYDSPNGATQICKIEPRSNFTCLSIQKTNKLLEFRYE